MEFFHCQKLRKGKDRCCFESETSQTGFYFYYFVFPTAEFCIFFLGRKTLPKKSAILGRVQNGSHSMRFPPPPPSLYNSWVFSRRGEFNWGRGEMDDEELPWIFPGSHSFRRIDRLASEREDGGGGEIQFAAACACVGCSIRHTHTRMTGSLLLLL